MTLRISLRAESWWPAHTSPKYVTVMPQAAAIITDAGSPTGHMALLAREFQVPTILNTGKATQILQPGQEVTVDANYNNVYAGIITELLEPNDPRPTTWPTARCSAP